MDIETTTDTAAPAAKKQRIDRDAVRTAAAGRWTEIIAHVGGIDPEYFDGRNHACPKCSKGSEHDGPFRAVKSHDGEERPFCASCLPHCTDVFCGVGWALGRTSSNDFPVILEAVASYLGIGPVTTTPARSVSTKRESSAKPAKSSHVRKGKPIAEPDELDRVYRAILSVLSVDGIKQVLPHVEENQLLSDLVLTPAHRHNLHDRGLSDSQIAQQCYRSFPRHPLIRRAAFEAAKAAGAWERVPGIATFASKVTSGILIPIFDTAGRAVRIRLRLDKPPIDPKTGKAQGRYRWLSAGDIQCEWPAHTPIGIIGPCDVVRASEGEFKAAIATYKTGIPTIAFAGVATWRTILEPIAQLQAKTVRLAFDSDVDQNIEVAKALSASFAELTAAGLTVAVERWPSEFKGIDDALAAGATIECLTGDAAAEYVKSVVATAGEASSNAAATGLPEIELDVDELKVADAAIEALAAGVQSGRVEVFQRLGRLVEVHKAKRQTRTMIAPKSARIIAFDEWRLRELLSTVARYGHDGEEGFKARAIPTPTVRQVYGRRQWASIPDLVSIAQTPTFLPDGSVVDSPGFHEQTGLYFASELEFPKVPDQPTQDDAKRAAAEILEAACDFPFADERHRAAWLAAGLTVAARPAIAGPTPLFAIDANMRGAGKSRLGDIIGIIFTGSEPEPMPLPEKNEELKKQILSVIKKGVPVAMFDNVARVLAYESLDMLLTRETYGDRELGTSNQDTFPNSTVWIATGNNLRFGGDIARRVLRLRLESPFEVPENRKGFKHPRLLDWVRVNRPRLASAFAIILRAWHVAGRPGAGDEMWGSFEAFSSVVPPALKFCGLSEILSLKKDVHEEGDEESTLLDSLLCAWQKADVSKTGMYVKHAIEAINQLAAR